MLAVGSAADAVAQNVVVMTDQRGQGLLTHFGTRCVVITAAHVVGGFSYAVVSTDRPGEPPINTKPARSFPFDVVVLEPDPPITTCDGELADLGVSGPLSPGLTLRMVEPGGLMVQFPVTVHSDDGIVVYVKPDGSGSFQPGMSGATLAMDGVPVAMLLAVVGGEAEAEAIRLDVATKWMIPYLRPAPVADLEADGDTVAVGALLSDPEAGAEAQANAAPVDDSSDPRNLLTDRSSPWRGRIVARPVEVTITLAGGDAGEVRCVMVEPGPDTPPTAMPRTVAVFYRLGSGSWRQAGWGEPSLVEGIFTLSLSGGLRADAIKLQLGDPIDGSDVLEIGRIAVLNQPCAG